VLPAVLFFVRVNQVLVRLWARVIGVGPFGLMVVPLSGCMSDRARCPSGWVPQRLAARVQRRVKRDCLVVLSGVRAHGHWGAIRQDPVMCEESSSRDDPSKAKGLKSLGRLRMVSVHGVSVGCG
jgi:hypothetical protein